jgi:hypothetical protein
MLATQAPRETDSATVNNVHLDVVAPNANAYCRFIPGGIDEGLPALDRAVLDRESPSRSWRVLLAAISR